MLLSILLLVSKPLSLKRAWLSGLSLAISVLSKELTVFLIPVLVGLVAVQSDKANRRFAVVGWLTLVLSLISIYVLMAVLKGELFPAGTLLGGSGRHVSLLCTLQYQGSRGRDGGLLDTHSAFWQMVTTWLQDEPLLLIGGTLGSFLSLFSLRRRFVLAAMGLAALALWVFLGRGGEILGFYLVPLLPLLALNLALAVGAVVGSLVSLTEGHVATRRAAVSMFSLLVATGLLLGLARDYSSANLGFAGDHLVLWRNQQAVAQTRAVSWIQRNISPESTLIVEDSTWTDLHDPAVPGRPFTRAHWYWKVQRDPEVRDGVFRGDWHRVGYVVTTLQLVSDTNTDQLELVREALIHSTTVVRFDEGGYPVEIRRVEVRDTVSIDGLAGGAKLAPELQAPQPRSEQACTSQAAH
jgi:hypothetical protein